MPCLHVCNTFFEKELESRPHSIEHWFRSKPILTQLQFLPLLYAKPDDLILVSDLPDNPDPRLCLIEQAPTHLPIEHWGPSLSIQAWAQQHDIPYSIPPWEVVRTVNSKIFSFTESPKLPGSALLETREAIDLWIENTPDPKVLKTPFGTAGYGHIHNPKKSNVKPLYTPPLIGEPWVERVMDFSTQWKDEELLGVTVFENDSRGTYKGTYVAEVEPWALQEHLTVARPLLKKIKNMGYSGHVGIDAYVYLWKGEKRVQPVVEINGRKTMSWVALQTPNHRLFFTHSPNGLLPTHVKNTRFAKNIHCT